MSAREITIEDPRDAPPDSTGQGARARGAEDAPGKAWRFADAEPLQSLRQTGRSSLTRRILFLNLVALLVLLSGILYLNQFRQGLIDARVRSLLVQGEIIAGAIAASAAVDTSGVTLEPEQLVELGAGESFEPTADSLSLLEFPIDPERVAPVLRQLISPTRTQARIYDRDGILILDSRRLLMRGQILRYDLQPPAATETGFSFESLWRRVTVWLQAGDRPLYEETGPANGRDYPEVAAALSGTSAAVERVNAQGELIVSVAVPVQRFRAVLGALLLSTQGGDIDSILKAERNAMLRVFTVAAAVTTVLSLILASTIAGPMRRLAEAAERVRHGVHAREEIPDYTHRNDEIGNLSGALRDMTAALFERLDAIESFAADVAHELKNPLTSLRSAVETLPLARTSEQRARLIEVVQHDVQRLDRLITDISASSRLDAELQRSEGEVIDVAEMMRTIFTLDEERRGSDDAALKLGGESGGSLPVVAQSGRLLQVITNLIGNARSFSPPDGTVRVGLRGLRREIEIVVEDDGPGTPPENLGRVFERFYTDRPGAHAFGNNSGLGLSISRQIVEAYGGRIWAENRMGDGPDGPQRLGARFIIRLPRYTGDSA
ncbi:MAG: stimulus-sensing domain-containing protein [Pseudomonadota bacterium]